MKNYIGIDLGTTNSVICSYDGENVRIWKSPEQNDVTPSAIFVDRNGRKFYGSRAYTQAPRQPKNSVTLFKRFMGTDKKIELPGANLTLTPIECSSEILRVLFSYLSEEIRLSPETVTVITVPAAFNQAKKDATKKAAELAGLGKVALMQEPVAAIMSVMSTKKQDGVFIVYDLGGGTFDVSIAENIGGKVNLLTQGGIEMCGGRDIDREIFSNIVRPWLDENFHLPSDFQQNPAYNTLCKLAEWATERAKIELSSQNDAIISLGEFEVNTCDLDGTDIYLDIPVDRDDIASVISKIVTDTIKEVRAALEKVGLGAKDIEKIVFVGGPTNYKPLRDMVSAELGIPTTTNLNPMTAVAEGASIFAESIDWDSIESSGSLMSKSSSGMLSGKDITFKYIARTTADRTKAMVLLSKILPGFTFEISSPDTGYISGRIQLENKASVTLPLSKNGENKFTVAVYDSNGQPISLPKDEITITKTLVSSISIPASHSIGIETLDKIGGTPVLHFLVNEGDDLPVKDSLMLRSTEEIQAGDVNTVLNIKLWEGNIQNPISDNRSVGVLKISGGDFADGVLRVGDEINCEYEINNAENIRITVSIPSIHAEFNGNYNGEIAMPSRRAIISEAEEMQERIEALSEEIEDERLDKIRSINSEASNLSKKEAEDAEKLLKTQEELLEAKKMLAELRGDYQLNIRKHELEKMSELLDDIEDKPNIPSVEIEMLRSLINSCERVISQKTNEFEQLKDEFYSNIQGLLFRTQLGYVAHVFNHLTENPELYENKSTFYDLKERGEKFLHERDADGLRKVVVMLVNLLPDGGIKDVLPTLGSR